MHFNNSPLWLPLSSIVALIRHTKARIEIALAPYVYLHSFILSFQMYQSFHLQIMSAPLVARRWSILVVQDRTVVPACSEFLPIKPFAISGAWYLVHNTYVSSSQMVQIGITVWYTHFNMINISPSQNTSIMAAGGHSQLAMMYYRMHTNV